MSRDMLYEKERRAVRLLRSVGDTPVEVSYSGGKDSDVILALAKAAGVNYRAIYKSTTIDPPGTIAHCKSAGAEIMRPRVGFFDLIARKGYPSRFSRFCCEALKEYKVMDCAVYGIRRSESRKRAERYKEPEMCRVYRNKERVRVLLPILEWTDADVKEYVTQNGIQCHSLYYDDSGAFHPERRLGCMACPLRSDVGLAEFKKFPGLVRAWIRAGQRFRDRARDTPPPKTLRMFADVYEYFFYHVFCERPHPYEYFLERKHTMFGDADFKALLEEYFQTDLTIRQTKDREKDRKDIITI